MNVPATGHKHFLGEKWNADLARIKKSSAIEEEKALYVAHKLKKWF